MTEGPDEASEALKRIKQLENQNIKFRNLLKAVLELSSQDAKGITNLQNESDSLRTKVENLEREKLQLESELNAVLEEGGSEMLQTVHKMQQENTELKTRFENIINKIKKENLDVGKLKAESAELKKTLMELENEKAELIEKIHKVGENSNDVRNSGIRSQKNSFETESGNFSMTSSFEKQSSSNLLPTTGSFEDTFKNYVEEQTNINSNISKLEQKNEELIKVVQKTNSTDISLPIKINEEIINSNTNFLSKVDEVRSKMEKISNDFIKTPKDMLDDKISELENAKIVVYKELEKYLLESSNEISELTKNVSDPHIKKLVNEMEIQKAVLLYNLQSAKVNPNQSDLDQAEVYLPSVPNSTSDAIILSNKSVSFQLAQSSETIASNSKENKHSEHSFSKDSHQRLEEEINRLEQERERLLVQFHSISAASANRSIEIVTQNEIQLQTPSELHSTFMRESSHEVIVAQNYDDATNQLYADEDARLEQRIRELEMENIRIQRELDSILEEIRADKGEMSRLQSSEQVLRERIDELEHYSPNKTD